MSLDAIRLVALDIDGTLLEPGVDPRDMPGDKMTAAIQRMQERGIIVVLASGRMYPGTVSVAGSRIDRGLYPLVSISLAIKSELRPYMQKFRHVIRNNSMS